MAPAEPPHQRPSAPGSGALDIKPLTGAVVTITAASRRAELTALLHAAGAHTLPAPIPRPGKGTEHASRRAASARFINTLLRREVHAITFTTAPSVTALLESAAVTGTLEPLLTALREDVLPVCLAAASARPLEAVGVSPLTPDRPRFPALVELLAANLPKRIRCEVRLDAHRTLIIQGFSADVAGHCVTLSPLPAAVLAELARRPGWVVSRAELLHRIWHPRDGSGVPRDEHAVEATIARLRTALGPAAGLIRTVTKRGYRLAVDPSHDGLVEP